ncbi:MAG: ParB/RepB/Spo0J family partition protein [Cytophagaceae bacterium]|nr:ParB/RepB/Spo0J family partition protein [Cytophagaceae bacterium]MDW8456317.1 ParB/RepB/Spo0J family partition protein [Cytophagaceae bacterium]
MATKKPALGRGLNALLKDSTKLSDLKTSATVVNLNEIPIDNIETNPYQPRTHFDQEALQELAESIKIHGIIQPITVRKLSEHSYQLISGERRLQASKIAGLKTIPAFIRTANDEQMLEMGLIENIQREDLNALEIALSYQRLISEFNLKQEQLGEKVGKNRTTVNNYLRLLKLPPDIQAALRDDEISMGHARAIINIEKAEDQLAIFKRIVKEDLSVRKTEELVRELAEAKKKNTASETAKEKPKKSNPEIVHLQNKLSSHFGTKISIVIDEKNKGEIKIPFLSTEDLNRILDILDVKL